MAETDSMTFRSWVNKSPRRRLWYKCQCYESFSKSLVAKSVVEISLVMIVLTFKYKYLKLIKRALALQCCNLSREVLLFGGIKRRILVVQTMEKKNNLRFLSPNSTHQPLCQGTWTPEENVTKKSPLPKWSARLRACILEGYFFIFIPR